MLLSPDASLGIIRSLGGFRVNIVVFALLNPESLGFFLLDEISVERVCYATRPLIYYKEDTSVELGFITVQPEEDSPDKARW